MKIIHFHRKRRLNANYSVEGFYENLRNALSDRIQIEVVSCPFESNGIFRRLYNIIYATFKQGDINHITGDVSYLNLFFSKRRNAITILDCGLLAVTKGFIKKIYEYFWFSLPIKRARYVIAISEATKREIVHYTKCDPEKIKVIYVAISPIFKRTDRTFNDQKPVILHIGTAPNKNLSRLIEALQGINCKLEIVGMISPDEKQKLEEFKIDYNVSVGLSNEEVFQKYVDCDVLAFVSTYEGFGMPIIEANTVGRVVVTSNILSMPEVAGDAALLVDPYKVDEIRNGILKVIRDKEYRSGLISNGEKNILRFDINKISDDYLDFYKNLN